ncbi:O-antigen ligase family protein [uncultured Microbacterium sp.]|uniref:O-antigen ligase family protein n=1 Tax=uncultured Microbacterium sp. TaxID=191216 RepID=UPI002628EE77|nr:O-antigen ligase family protein [uncultured Microbacterium sp.]
MAQPVTPARGLTRWLAETPLLEFSMAILLAAGANLPGLPIEVPTRYVAMIVLVAVATTRIPRFSSPELRLFIVALALLVTNYAIVSATAAPMEGASDWRQRLFRLALLLIFTVFAATGRLRLIALIDGFAVGLVLNAGLFYAGAAPHDYQEFLSGFVGDKNAAGLLYAIGGLLLVATQSSRTMRACTLVLFSALTFLTGSRTTMAGLLVAVIWLTVFARRQQLTRILAAVGLWFALSYVQDNLARVGIFADRSGTDALRAQIADKVAQKLATTPPQGSGLGTAFVRLSDHQQFFFHDSYATALVEGGFVALVIIVGVTAWIGLRPLRPDPGPFSRQAMEAATLVLLVTAMQLGEVFLTIGWALVMAVAIRPELSRNHPSHAAHPA